MRVAGPGWNVLDLASICGTIEVHHPYASVVEPELGVVGADPRVVDHQVVLGTPTDRKTVFEEQLLPGRFV